MRNYPALVLLSLPLILAGCTNAPGSKADLEQWDADRVYNPSDGKYYHRSEPPKARDVLFQQESLAAREFRD